MATNDLEAPLLVDLPSSDVIIDPDPPGTPTGSVRSHGLESVPANEGGEVCVCPAEGCGTLGGVANLVTTAVGAGMLALPCAVSKTGILLGALLLCLVAGLTFASCNIIVRYASSFRTSSYGDLVYLHFGRPGAVLLQSAITLHVTGVMIGYNVIIADVLVGSAPRFTGMLPTILGRHDDPWWLSRPFVLAALMLVVVLPMLVPRNLTAVAKFSSFSVCMLFVLASAISGLAVVAAGEGKLAPGLRWLPSLEAMGGTPLDALTSVLTVISVSALAYTCQFNLVPIQKSLKDSSSQSMFRVLCYGLALCAALYAAVAISGYALFGSDVDGDVLKNLTSRFVSTLVPRVVAHGLIYGVALSYTLCLLANFVLKVWAVRESICELLVGQPASNLEATAFYGMTLLLVLLAYTVSVLVPSIYGLLALVGATATVVFSYLFPSLLVLKCKPNLPQRIGAFLLLSLGGLMAATAIYDRLTGQGLE